MQRFKASWCKTHVKNFYIVIVEKVDKNQKGIKWLVIIPELPLLPPRELEEVVALFILQSCFIEIS